MRRYMHCYFYFFLMDLSGLFEDYPFFDILLLHAVHLSGNYLCDTWVLLNSCNFSTTKTV